MASKTPREKGVAIDHAINQYHYGQPIPVLSNDLQDIYEAYVNDFENDNVYAIQQSIKFQVDGSWFVGRADQLRHSPSGLAVWDVKYSYLEPTDIINKYIESLMIYAYGLKVRIGGIINVKNYGTNKPVFVSLDLPCPTTEDMRKLTRLIHVENEKRKSHG